MSDTSFRVYAGGSYLRRFSFANAARGYCEEVVKESDPNIGEVELYRHTIGDHCKECVLVANYGVPKGRTVRS